jgi:hypothetical protein
LRKREGLLRITVGAGRGQNVEKSRKIDSGDHERAGQTPLIFLLFTFTVAGGALSGRAGEL